MIEDPQSLPLPTPQPILPLWSHTKSVLNQKFSNSSHLVDVFHLFHFLHVHQTYSMISYPDMEFVKNFTQPDFQAKNFTPQKCVNCDIFSRINSVNASNINNLGIF